MAVHHINSGVAANAACGEGHGIGALAAAKHVALQARVAMRADDKGIASGLVHGDMGVAQDVAVFAATMHRAIDDATRYCNV